MYINLLINIQYIKDYFLWPTMNAKLSYLNCGVSWDTLRIDPCGDGDSKVKFYLKYNYQLHTSAINLPKIVY